MRPYSREASLVVVAPTSRHAAPREVENQGRKPVARQPLPEASAGCSATLRSPAMQICAITFHGEKFSLTRQLWTCTFSHSRRDRERS